MAQMQTPSKSQTQSGPQSDEAKIHYIKNLVARLEVSGYTKGYYSLMSVTLYFSNNFSH